MSQLLYIQRLEFACSYGIVKYSVDGYAESEGDDVIHYFDNNSYEYRFFSNSVLHVFVRAE